MSTNVEPILSFVKRRLEEKRGSWVDVARDSGVPYHTLTKIAQGQVENPRIETVQRLVDYFHDQPAPVVAAAQSGTQIAA